MKSAIWQYIPIYITMNAIAAPLSREPFKVGSSRKGGYHWSTVEGADFSKKFKI
jgi:hypothetical protein